jgi:hypothetical protein
MAGLHAFEDFRMRQMHTRAIAGVGVGVEGECRAVVEHGGAAGESADPKLRSLKVDQDADRPAVVLLDLADRIDHLAHAVMRRVTHVDAEHVGAGLEQPPDHGGVAGGGP